MRIIYKYALTHPVQDFFVPENASVVHVAYQRGSDGRGLVPTVWMECDLDVPDVTRSFGIVATGESWPDDARYLGTCIDTGSTIVLHVIEFKWRKALRERRGMAQAL